MSEQLLPKSTSEIFNENLSRERKFPLSQFNDEYLRALQAKHKLMSFTTLDIVKMYIDSFSAGDTIQTCAGNINIPLNYQKKLAKNRRGWVFFDDRVQGDQGIIRIAYPDQNYLRWVCQTIQSYFQWATC